MVNPLQPFKWVDDANYVYEEYLSKPYTATEIPEDLQLTAEGVTIPRPNHGLVHTLRTTLYVSLVVHAYNLFNQPKLTASDIDDLQVALLFYVSGRENEASFGQEGYLRYRQKSADAFEKYVRSQLRVQFTDKKIDFYKNGILDPYSTSPPHFVIIRICHDLDLARCYTKAKFKEKIKEASHHVHNLAKPLAKCAIECLRQTGDRIIGEQAYNAPLFIQCSRSVEITVKKIIEVFQIYQGLLMTTIYCPSLPPDLKAPCPKSPWMISERLFKRVQGQAGGSFVKCEILPTDPEAEFVLKLFYHQKPHNYGIRKIWCIHNPVLTSSFESVIWVQENEAKNPTYAPKGKEEQPKLQREEVLNRFKDMTRSFSLIVIKEPKRKEKFTNVTVLPLWHGSTLGKCESICSAGFTSFGKHHHFSLAANQGANKSTDVGWFGSGIYFTTSARYATMYSDGHLILSWVSMREPYPVVNDIPHPQKGSDMEKLSKGLGHYQNYNAHYIPVASIKPDKFACMEYYPCYKDQMPVWDEIVVFNKEQTVPRFWIELATDSPAHPLKDPFPFPALPPHINVIDPVAVIPGPDAIDLNDSIPKLDPEWINTHPNIPLKSIIGLDTFEKLIVFLGKGTYFSWQKNSHKLKCLNLAEYNLNDEQFRQIIGLCPKITFLSAKNCHDLTDNAFEALKSLQISSADFTGCMKLTDKGVENLKDLPLEDLNLSGCVKLTDKFILSLVNMPLKMLNLSNCIKLTDKVLAGLKGKILTSIDLQNCPQITDNGLLFLEGMPLSSVNLSYCPKITDKALLFLKGMPLTSIAFSSCENLTDKTLELVKDFMLLISIDFSRCYKLTGQGLQHLSKMKLQYINFSYCQNINEQDLDCFKSMRLRTIIFCGCEKFTDQAIAKFILMPLTKVDFSWCYRLTNQTLEYLRNVTTLTTLAFKGCKGFTDSGLAFLKPLPLSEIDFSRCIQLTEEGIENFKYKKLISVNFSGCPEITDNAFEHLKDSPMQTINFSDCKKITGQALKKIKHLKIVELSFEGCENLSDQSLVHLRDMPLMKVNFNDTKVTKTNLQIINKDF